MPNQIISRYGAICSGNMEISGSTTSVGGFTGSLLGTSSYSLTSSFALNGGFSLTTGSTYPITASWSNNALTANAINFTPATAVSASWASSSLTSLTSSYVSSSAISGKITSPVVSASWASMSISASYAPSISSSYALTASYIGSGTNGYFPIWGNNTLTATSSIYQSASFIGIATTSPRGLVDINNSITVETALTGSLVFSYGDGNGDYIAEGNTFGIKVYPYKVIGAVTIYSTTPLTITGSDDNSFNNMQLHFSWSAVAGADGYKILYSDPYYLGSNYDFFGTTVSSSIVFGDVDANENNFQEGATVTPTSFGSNLYFDSSGNIIHTGSLYTSEFHTTTTNYSSLSGSLYISSTGDLPGFTGGNVAQLLVENPTGVARMAFRGNGAAVLAWICANGPSNAKYYQFYVNSIGQLNFSCVNDIGSSETPIMQFNRTGQTPNDVSILNGAALKVTTGFLSVGGNITGSNIISASNYMKTAGIEFGIRSVTNNASLANSDYTLLCNNTASITITLPSAGNSNRGRVFNIKAINSGSVVISGSQTIDNAANYTIGTQYNTVTLQNNGTQWWIL